MYWGCRRGRCPVRGSPGATGRSPASATPPRTSRSRRACPPGRPPNTEQALLLAHLLIDSAGEIDAVAFAGALSRWEADMVRPGSADLLGPSALGDPASPRRRVARQDRPRRHHQRRRDADHARRDSRAGHRLGCPGGRRGDGRQPPGAGPPVADALDPAERAAAAGTVQAGSATWDTPNTSPGFPSQPSTPREPATHCAVFAAELLRGVSPTVTPVRTGLQGERAGSAR